MEFRDLKSQYEALKKDIDEGIQEVLTSGQFIGGPVVKKLEEDLARYVGRKHCISCGNGTDALFLVLKAWGIGKGDCVFVPDFTFFASAEVISAVGASPIFVDVDKDTFNISLDSLKLAFETVLQEGVLNPKAVISVDLFGLPADYKALEPFCQQRGLRLLEDSAQGFSGAIEDRRAGSFGDAATTSFFPAKPLGCYGDGGAIFTDDDDLANLVRSLAVHGKGKEKYDNVRIGYNSRLDAMQAAILKVKFNALVEYETTCIQQAARRYDDLLEGVVKTPTIPEGLVSAWAQYSILCQSQEDRDAIKAALKAEGIPSMVYYPKGMHQQTAFLANSRNPVSLENSIDLTERVLSLPISPYIEEEDQTKVVEIIRETLHG